MPFCVVKIGGSLIGQSRVIVSRLIEQSDKCGFLVVPGGGPMANLVRSLFRRYDLSQETAHWMAVLAMEQYAHFMADGTKAKLTQEIKNYPQGVKILLPYKMLLEDDCGIEHSWDYTSDSVAALVACRLGAFMVKATDVDGVMLNDRVVDVIFAKDLMETRTCIDQGALNLLNSCSGRCRVLNGKDPQSFIANMINDVGGTLIKGK